MNNIDLNTELQNFQNEILKNISEGVYLIKASDGTIVYTNEVFDKMFGYERGEMLGKNVSVVNSATGGDPQEKVKEIMAIIESTGKWYGEIQNIKKDGTIFTCYVKVTTFEHHIHGKVLISIHTDITDKQNSEQKFATIFQHIPICTNLTRYSDGKFSDVNDAFLNVIGYSREEVVGKTSLELNLWVSPETRAKIVANLTKDGKSLPMSAQWRRKDGNILDILVQAYIIYINNEKFMLGIVEDITEKKLASEKTKEVIERLEKTNRLMVGRELEMVRLKTELADLKGKINK